MTDTPSRAVARYDGPRTTADLREYAMLLAFDTDPEGKYKRNDALPVAFRGNPAAVAFAVEYAKALDVSPITALIGIHIVDGKPTASAGLISALVRRAGHKIRTWVEGSIEDGTAKGITTISRADDEEFEYRSEWTLPRAVRAGLMKQTADGRFVSAKERSAWATYPENMLKSRTITECARDAAEDAILGVHYTPEELGVEVDEAGEPVYTVTQVPPTPADAPRDAPAPSPAPAADSPAPSADAPTPAPQTPATGDTDADAIVDACRTAILRARTRDDMAAVWGHEPIRNSSERAAFFRTVDHNGEECTLLDLFKAASAGIRSGAFLIPDDKLDKHGLTGPDADPDVVDMCGDCGHLLDDCQCPAVDHAPNDANLVDLERLLPKLQTQQPQAFADVVAWAEKNGHDLATHDDEVAGVIVEAIATGDALSRSWIETLTETPFELVTRLLNAEPIEEVPPTAADLKRLAEAEAAEERRREAAEAKPATRGRSSERRTSATTEARRAAEAVKNAAPHAD